MAYKLTSLGDGAWLSLIDLRAFKTAHQRASAPECQVKGDRITADERDSVKTVTEQLMELLQANPGIRSAEFRKVGGVARSRQKSSAPLPESGL